MQLSHGFAVGQSIFPWFRHVGSWHPCDSCPPSHWVIRKLFQCEFCTGTTCAPSEPAVAKHTDWLNNVQVARPGDGMPRVHPCMLGHVFVHFFPVQLETFIRRRKVVTWSRPRTKILPAASRGQWLTQHDFSWLLVHLEF